VARDASDGAFGVGKGIELAFIVARFKLVYIDREPAVRRIFDSCWPVFMIA
jgi:hypothetical protein